MINQDQLFLNRSQLLNLSTRGLTGDMADEARTAAEMHLSHAKPTVLVASPETVFVAKQPALGNALGGLVRFQQLLDPEQLVSLREVGDVTNKSRSELLALLQTGDRIIPVGSTAAGDRVYHLSDIVSRFDELKLETSALKPSAIKALSGLKTIAPAGFVPHQGSQTAIEGAATLATRAVGAGAASVATTESALPPVAALATAQKFELVAAAAAPAADASTIAASATAHLDELAEKMGTSASPSSASTVLAVAEQADHTPITVLRAEASTVTKALSKVRQTPLLALAYAAPLAGGLIANTASTTLDLPQPVRVAADVIGAGGGALAGWKIAKMVGGAGKPAAVILALSGGASGLGAMLSVRGDQ